MGHREGCEWVGRAVVGARKGLEETMISEWRPEEGEESAWQCLEKRLRDK